MRNIAIISFLLIIIFLFISINMMSKDLFQKQEPKKKDSHIENLLQGSNKTKYDTENSVEQDYVLSREYNVPEQALKIPSQIKKEEEPSEHPTPTVTLPENINLNTESNNPKFQQVQKELTEKYNNDPNAEVSEEDLVKIFNQLLGQ